MNEFEKKVLTFYTMLANAYREPEDMEEAVDKLTLYTMVKGLLEDLLGH